jgi:hypothetical protein
MSFHHLHPSALLFALTTAALVPAQDCTVPIEMVLTVSGSGASQGTLRFTLQGVPSQHAALLAISAFRGLLATPVMTLCLADTALVLPFDATDAGGCAEAVLNLPPLPAGFAFRVHAQAAAAPNPVVAGTVKTSNPLPVDLYGPTAAFAVTSMDPVTGGHGTAVTIGGSGFGSTARDVTVWFGGTPVPPTSVANNQVQVTVPHLRATGPLAVAVQVGIPRVAAGTFTAAPGTEAGPVPGWVGVGFANRPAANAADLEQRIRAAGGRLLNLDLFLFDALCATAPGQEAAFATAMLAAGAVRAQQDQFVVEDGVGDPGAPNDPQRASQWHLDLVGRSTRAGPLDPLLVTVDSGVDLTHSDLVGRRLATRMRIDIVEDDSTPQDVEGHGTRVAGVMVANADNARHVTGMVPQMPVLPIRANTQEEFARGIALMVVTFRAFGGQRPLLINVSNRLDDLVAVRGALAFAINSGIAVIKSAGNTGADVTYATAAAAGYPDLLIVSGIARTRDAAGRLRLWPNSARTLVPGAAPWREVDIAAPSEGIVSTNFGDTHNAPGGADGTSYAAPQVAAALATIWSWTPRAAGETLVAWRNRCIDMLLVGCVRDIGTVGRDSQFGNGVLDLTGRIAFHSRGDFLFAQRSRGEASDVSGPFQIRTFPENGRNPRFSADRRRFAFDVGGSQIRVLRLDASENLVYPAVVVNATDVGQPVFDPRTGRFIAFVKSNALWMCNLDTLNAWAPVPAGAGIRMTPHWSADGRYIVCAETTMVTEYEVLRDAAGDVTGIGATRVLRAAEPSVSQLTAAYAPDADPVARTGRVCWARSWTNPDLSTSTEIYSMRLDGTGEVRLTGDGRTFNGDGLENFGPGFTPDGARIVFHTIEYRNSRSEWRHQVRAIPASPPAAGFGTVSLLHESAWTASVVPPMGIEGTSVCHSAVDTTRF